jgi:hypothetical protein
MVNSDGTTQLDNDQRKSTSVPTLMITVKNEMAQSTDEATAPSAGISDSKSSIESSTTVRNL